MPSYKTLIFTFIGFFVYCQSNGKDEAIISLSGPTEICGLNKVISYQLTVSNVSSSCSLTYKWYIFGNSSYEIIDGGDNLNNFMKIKFSQEVSNMSVVAMVYCGATKLGDDVINAIAVYDTEALSIAHPSINECNVPGGSYSLYSNKSDTKWYKDGVFQIQAGIFTVTLNSNSEILARATNSCGEVEEKIISYSIYPESPVVNSQEYLRFGEGSVVLNAFPGMGGTACRWYYNESSTTSIGQTSYYTTPSHSSNYTYYVSTYNESNGCESQREYINVSILPIPSITVSGYKVRYGQPIYISVNDNYEVYEWEKDGEKLIGESLNEVAVYSSGTYRLIVWMGSAKYTSDPIYISDVQDVNMNYIRRHNILISGINTIDMAVKLDSYKRHQLNTYYDGLARPIQVVHTQRSPNQKDIINIITYDDFGRKNQEYLPFVSSTGDGVYIDNAYMGHWAFYNPSHGKYNNGVKTDYAAYLKKLYEPSPLNRVKEEGIGAVWQPVEGDPSRKTRKFDYNINSSTDQIKLFSIIGSTNDLLTFDSFYLEGHLTKNVTTDEDGHQVQEFVDKLGQTVLKRVQSHENGAEEEWADTYYIYDDFGNLRFVLPPMANKQLDDGATIDDAFLAQWAFSYKYDARQRMVEKRVPGAGWVFMIYDDRDRLVLSQDANQRLTSRWNFTKYDALNRPVMTGEKVITTTVEVLRDLLDGQDWLQNYAAYETLSGDKFGYTSNSLPKNIALSEIYTVTYYDNYTFKSVSDWDAYNYDPSQLNTQITPQGTYTFPSAAFDRVKGQVTGSMIKVLDGNDTWLGSVNYYDDRYRLIQTVAENHSGDIDKYSTLYNFPGWVLATKTSHQKGSDTYGIKKWYTYDHVGRLMQGYHELIKNGASQGEVLLAENKYNELGELIEKNLHVENNVPHQSIDYRYNIRGWLESVNNSTLQIEPGKNIDDATPDLFGMELLYNHPLNGVPTGN